jgi:DNA-binding response OmpR family regulator
MGAVPVIVLTSSDSPRDRSQAEKLGASAYIRKPSNLEEFMAIGDQVRRALGAVDG